MKARLGVGGNNNIFMGQERNYFVLSKIKFYTVVLQNILPQFFSSPKVVFLMFYKFVDMCDLMLVKQIQNTKNSNQHQYIQQFLQTI